MHRMGVRAGNLKMSDACRTRLPMDLAYRNLRLNGDIFVAVALGGCLVLPNWAFLVLCTFLGLVYCLSFLRSIWHSFINYNFPFFENLKVKYYNYKIVATFLYIPLLAYHGGDFSEMETPAKVLLIFYIMVMNMDRFRWPLLVYGSAAGAVTAFIVGALQLELTTLVRSEGMTNSIRFGMIALILGAICGVGLLRTRSNRLLTVISTIGLASGFSAAFMSGSRGALLALPVVFLLFVPPLWRRSRLLFLLTGLLLASLGGGLLLANVGKTRDRLGTAYNELFVGDKANIDWSINNRIKLLVIAYDLFKSKPILGVGEQGWNAEVERVYKATAKDKDRLLRPYNQAHNQYADDLAKGGIVRFLLGLLTIFMPLYLFLRCRPYEARPGSEFAFAGFVISAAFAIYCLSESLLLLNVSAFVHAILVIYLLAGCDTAALAKKGPPAARPRGPLARDGDRQADLPRPVVDAVAG